MKPRVCIIFMVVLIVAFVLEAAGEEVSPPGAGNGSVPLIKYVPKFRESGLEEMKETNKARKEKEQEATEAIRKAQDEARTQREKEEKQIRFDFVGVNKPQSPEDFEQVFHFPPTRQWLTGTCWAFSTTSYFESEVFRLTGKKIKLSEMYTAYWDFVEKARRFVRERGDSWFDEGSEGNVLMKLWPQYGIVPLEAYPGVVPAGAKYDQEEMAQRLKEYLKHVKATGFWDETVVVDSVRVILDHYMGRPPEHFKYKGKETTPTAFLKDVLKLKLEDYVPVMSTLSTPFNTFGEYEVDANWWHSKDYYNVPLDQFYQILVYAIQHGYSVRFNGDVSEPGYNGYENAAIIPPFDIPPEYIDQDAREFRFANKTTGDDHDIHMVGYTRIDDHDWFLIKDSASSSHLGKFGGYYFYRDDYVKLKMLTFIVHKDAIKAVLGDFRTQNESGG